MSPCKTSTIHRFSAKHLKTEVFSVSREKEEGMQGHQAVLSRWLLRKPRSGGEVQAGTPALISVKTAAFLAQVTVRITQFLCVFHTQEGVSAATVANLQE